MMQPDRKRPVTLEDILSLKRNERPPAEFWSQFDRELRAKQLAALVEKRPWWRSVSFSGLFGSARRYRFHLPLGAAALFAVTFFSVRGFHSSSTALVATSQVASLVDTSEAKNAGLVQTPTRPTTAKADFTNNRQLASAAPVSNQNELVATVSPVVPANSTLSELQPTALEVTAPTLAKAQFVLSSEATTDGDLAHAIAGLPGADDTTFASPSARLIAENLAALQADDAMLSNSLLGSARPFEVRGSVARNRPIEPLAQLRVQSSARRSAVISSATFVSTTAPVATSERAARGLSDERFYDTVSRVNARGAGMLFKF